jgi:signal transduction histidine kinase
MGFFQKLGLLFSHLYGKGLFLWLRSTYRDVIRETEPLSWHLESNVFPLLREESIKWLILKVHTQEDIPYLSVEREKEGFDLPGTEILAQKMDACGVKRIRLDSRLESGQIVEALLMLFYAAPRFDQLSGVKPDAFVWNSATIASAMTHGQGFHKFCAHMRYDPDSQIYEVEYTYCELFFSRVVRNYINIHKQFQDHRVLFRAAPRIAILALIFFTLPAIVIQWNSMIGMELWLLVSAILAIWIGLMVQAIGSMLYDREHRDLLIQEYLKRIADLARFPEADPHPVIKLGRNAEMLYTNPSAEKLMKQVDHTGQSYNQILPGDIRQLVDQCLEDGQARESEVQVDGRSFFYLVSPFPDDKSVICVGSEVTQLRRAEKNLREKNEELSRMSELKDEFMRIASHDLKNPLTTILSSSSLITQLLPPGEVMTERMHHVTGRIHTQAQNMQKIIEDFLDLQVIDDDRLRLNRQEINLGQLLERVKDNQSDYAEEKGLEVDLKSPDSDVLISGDTARLEQVVQNLLGNAIKFGSQGDRIELRCRVEDNQALIEVEDEGPGLTPEDLEKVFRKYSRLSNKPTGGEKSSGLGLYLSRQLVEAHGGAIGVRNNSSKGATFWFSIPLTPVTDVATPPQ